MAMYSHPRLIMEWLPLFAQVYVILSGVHWAPDPPGLEPRVEANLTCPPASMTSERPKRRIPYTVHIEGNVGCGKSTMVDILSKMDSRIQAVPEPVDRWQNVSGTGIDMLKLMFDDGKRWSGAFQLCSTLSRLNVALDIDEFKSVRIMERSIYSERYCFLENQLNTGMISSAEFSVMNRWFEFAKKNFRSYVKPDVIVYLRSDIDTLVKNIKKRGRSEEANIDPRFLEGLQRYHEDWLYYGNSTFPQAAKVIVINAALPLDEFTKEVQAKRDLILPPHIINN